jgi:hypothetical protein
MNDAQLLERLTSAYATVDAPAPSAALAERMDTGDALVDDEARDTERDAVVLPFAAPRPRMRMRYLVAALVASFVALSGLAAAGALPDSIQRQVSSVVSHIGIDLPSPASGPGDRTPGPSTVPADESRPSATTSPAPAAGGGTVDPTAGQTPAAAPPATSNGALDGVGTGGATTDTTLPPSGSGQGLLPVTLPPVALPPIAVPGLPLPPVSLPPIQIQLPPLLGH